MSRLDAVLYDGSHQLDQFLMIGRSCVQTQLELLFQLLRIDPLVDLVLASCGLENTIVQENFESIAEEPLVFFRLRQRLERADFVRFRRLGYLRDWSGVFLFERARK